MINDYPNKSEKLFSSILFNCWDVLQMSASCPSSDSSEMRIIFVYTEVCLFCLNLMIIRLLLFSLICFICQSVSLTRQDSHPQTMLLVKL